MNAIVQIALRRPYTFVVLAILIFIYGGRAIFSTPTDVFPNIRIPVVAVVWSYAGLLPAETSGRITYYYERALTTTVEGIERIESQSYYGFSIINIYLQPGVDVAGAEAEITAISQTVTKALPPDISPPMVMRLEASSVPVAMLQVTSDTLTPSQLYNLAIARIRPQLVVIQGAILPHPYGGQPRQLLVSLNPQKLLARHLTAQEVHDVLKQQNIILPAGDQKISTVDWMVQTNASPLQFEQFNDIPIKRVGNATVYLRDVADTQLAGPPQTNAVLVGGEQAVMLVVMKSGDASTLDVVAGVKEAIPQIERSLPKGVKIKLLNDASTFVKDSIRDVLQEMGTAAMLTGIVVLMFLGSWRSTVIIATSIPLAILTSIVCLNWIGESINIMTLGGLALAVGILVDDATVMIENIDTHLEMKKPLEKAIVDAANQIVVPTFVATLCIMTAWLPLFSLEGVSGYLFKPMAEAVIFAMAASFLLSRTLVPTMAKYLLGKEHEQEPEEGHKEPGRLRRFMQKMAEHLRRKHADAERPQKKTGWLSRFQHGFEERFNRFRDNYQARLDRIIQARARFLPAFLVLALGSWFLFYINGRDFFSEIKSGTLQMHMRAPLGTRIETTSRIVSLVSRDIARLLKGQVDSVVSNCGLPVGPHNLAFIPTPTIGSQDCDLTILLKDATSPVWDFRRTLRKNLKNLYPGTEFTFQPADLTAKILNFGSPSPIVVQIQGMPADMEKNFATAHKMAARFKYIPGAVDVVVQQTMRTPTLLVSGNRSFGMVMGLPEKEIAENLLINTSGSQQVDQSFWLDHVSGISYRLNVYTPQPWLTSPENLMTIPLSGKPADVNANSPQLLGNTADIALTGTPGVVTHVGIRPVFDIYVSKEGRDLGGVFEDVQKITNEMQKELPPASKVSIRGQAPTMRGAYVQLIEGLGLSIALIYLLIVVNFQSWLDPFIIITALPGALAGVAWALFLTHTNISVPALTGAIMSMGTATANSILVVSHARDGFAEHGDAFRAALEAGHARIRPVLMTASAMIVGMLPMSLGNSQNAPLGRAVIGGLLVATLATLFFVPCVYATIYHWRGKKEKKQETT